MVFKVGVSFPHGAVVYSQLSREDQLEYHRVKQRAAYALRVGGVKRNMSHTEETRAQWCRDKSNRRCTRAKLARRYDELTLFVYKEAHELRKQRNRLTGIEWHVDHIVPLINPIICGLHVWTNFAVILKVDNLRKGNYHSVHEEW